VGSRADEIRSLARVEESELESHLTQLMYHLLKLEYVLKQPYRIVSSRVVAGV
jgi:hypothetical protein